MSVAIRVASGVHRIMATGSSYKRVKGRSHTVEKRVHAVHALGDQPYLSHAERLTDEPGAPYDALARHDVALWGHTWTLSGHRTWRMVF